MAKSAFTPGKRNYRPFKEKKEQEYASLTFDTMVHGTQLELVSKDALREFRKKRVRDPKEDRNQRMSFRKSKKALGEGDDDEGPKLKPSILSLYYYEDLDVVVAGSEDSKICKHTQKSIVGRFYT